MIRPATINDVSRIAEILIFAKRTAYRPIFQNDRVSFNDMQVVPLAAALCQGSALDSIVVYDDGIVKGMMNYGKPVDSDDNGGLQLYELYVDPFFQGGGIGGALMRHLLDAARCQKAGRVHLWVLEKNHKARAFYENFGFLHDGGRRLETGTEEYLLRYIRQLTE